MRYLIAVLAVIFLIIFIIIKLLTGGSSEPKNLPPALTSYANTATTVRYTIDNPTQAAETHRDIIIDVGNTNATLTITSGYNGNVIQSNSFPMTVSAYSNFLRSLDISGGYTLGNNSSNLKDERGYCATNDRFIYDIVSGDGSLLQHYWWTSCGAKTFNGNPDTVKQLFTNQIPGFSDLTQNVDY